MAHHPPHKPSLRSLTALAAVYAFALQVMLAGIVATEMAAADPAVATALCSGANGTADRDGAPAHHGPCVVCAFASFSPPLPQTVEPAVLRPGLAVAFAPTAPAFSIESRRRDPQSARGPPQAA